MEKKEQTENKSPRKKIIFKLILLITILTVFETIIYQFRAQVNITDNVLILVALNLNIILLVILALLILRNLVKLYFERKQNVPGAKFRTKLVTSFIGLTLIPCVLLFLVASNLINTSIDSWFNAQNEESLKKALKVAQIYYDKELGKAFTKTRELSKIITKKALLDQGKKSELITTVKKIQKEFNLGVVKVFSSTKEEIIYSQNPKIPQSRFIHSISDLVNKALKGQEFFIVHKTNQGDLIDGVVPIVSRWREEDIVGALVFNIYDTHSHMEEINDIKNSYEEYKQRKILRAPIKSSYIITFLLITLLIIFSATWVGFYLAKGITIPIQRLAEGTRKVALGDWDYKVPIQADDEIGMLIESFNKMTDDLYSVHKSLQTTNQELDQRRNYIETVLENIASGVITVGEKGEISTINKAAAKILHFDKDATVGLHYKSLFDFSHLISLYLLLRGVEENKKSIVEKQIQLSVTGRQINLLVSVSNLFDEENHYMGMVCAFDDLTQLIKAQKMAAWQEVARRLAHEIKNPLTPIQLCTERLRKKFYEDTTEYKKIFNECTETIILEVNDLKTMIDEFSLFARMPLPNLKKENLNQLISTLLARYQQIYSDIEFYQELSKDIPEIDLDREQIKRVFINLFDNAIDSMIMNQKKKILKTISIYDTIMSKVKIAIIDNGMGMPPEDKTKLFVPYFSTKKEGRGLGLAIVYRIINDHNGAITVEDNLPKGTKFTLAFNVNKDY